MVRHYVWMFLLVLQCVIVTSRPTQSLNQYDVPLQIYNYDAQNKPKEQENNDQVISVRITSSVAVGRGRDQRIDQKRYENKQNFERELNIVTSPTDNIVMETTETAENADYKKSITKEPPNLAGANIEFIKQLNAKKETKNQNDDPIYPFQLSVQNKHMQDKENMNQYVQDPFLLSNQSYDSIAEPSLKAVDVNDRNEDYENIQLGRSASSPRSMEQFLKIKDRILDIIESKVIAMSPKYNSINDTVDTVAESSIKSVLTIINKNDEETHENIENVPIARSIPMSQSSKNYIQSPTENSPSHRGNSPGLTTVSFNVFHDTPNQSTNYNSRPSNINNNQAIGDPHKFLEPPKVYSQPAQVYSEPAKFYSEPAKVYSEPAKVYSEPAKIYSEPAKIYSEPAKFYSQPASLHLTPETVPNYTPWQNPLQSTIITSLPWQNPSQSTVMVNTTPTPPHGVGKQIVDQQPEKNYEVDEKISLLTDGRSHGIQESSTEKCKQDNCKVGYVVEGRQFKKYRVEERTPDGFIVGEYGVVRNEDGALRGVRYTADSDASPRLIYDALMKFLQLK